MFGRLKNWRNSFRLSLKTKMVLSLSAIAVVLIVSGIISIVEYRRMSNYVSDMIAEDINSINVAQKLSAVTDAYNLQILTVIGDDSVNSLPDFDQQGFVSYCDSLRSIFSVENVLPLTDSVLYSYQAYMLTSLELEQVIQSDFIDSRTWYFERLQPSFQRLNGDIDRLSQAMYADLQENSEDFDQQGFVSYCDSLRSIFSVENVLPLTDSVLYSYQAYMLTSLELEQVIQSDFIDSRTWYFERLQPSFQRLNGDIDRLSQAMYADLQENSGDFDRGFYRSIIPGIVAVGVGVILVLLLMFFITSFYVNPLNKMLEGLDEYRSMGRRYSYSFEGDDQLAELNEGITELTEENRQYRRRIKLLKETQPRTEESE